MSKFEDSIKSIVNEVRKNPEANTRETWQEFLGKYNKAGYFLHSTSAEKVGIFPKSSSSHDTPIGVFAFNIPSLYKNFFNERILSEPRPSLPYYGGEFMYILKPKASTKITTGQNYTEEEFLAHFNQMKKWAREEDYQVGDLESHIQGAPNYTGENISKMWLMSKMLSYQGIGELDQYAVSNPSKWNKILRMLGFQAIEDEIGSGFIHNYEGQQIMFLDGTQYEIVDKFKIFTRETPVSFGKQTFTRIPKELNIKGFSNVFFHNNSPDRFKKVKVWNVEAVTVDDLDRFINFKQPQTTSFINLLSVRVSGYGKLNLDFDKITKNNIKIKTVHIDSTDAYDIAKVFKTFTGNEPFEQLFVNPYIDLPDYYFDDVPESVMNKVIRDHKLI